MTDRWVLTLVGLLAACAGGAHGSRAGVDHAGVGNVTGAAPGSLDRSIRQLDFQNRTYDLGSNEVITVRNGDWQQRIDDEDDLPAWVHADRAEFGDVDGDGVEDAVVLLHDNPGGSTTSDIALVLSLRHGALVQIDQMEAEHHSDGGLDEVKPAPGGGVTVERNLLGCCPYHVQLESWRWNGHALVEDVAARRLEARDD